MTEGHRRIIIGSIGTRAAIHIRMAETCRKYSAVPIVRAPKRVCPRLLLRFPPEAEARWCNQQVPRLKTVFRVVAACATFYQLVNGA